MERQLEYAEGVLVTNSIDEEARTVKFYYARFDSPDARGRIMHKNAFNRTITNNLDKIYHLNSHNEELPIGKPIEFGSDAKGAWCKSRLSKNSDGEKALQLYKEGVYKYHSVGFYILNSEDKEGNELVTEARIAEVSTVLYPAHTGATLISLNTERDKRLNSIEESVKALSLDKSHTDSQKEISDAIKFIQEY